MTISITKPTVGGSENTWGATVNTALDDVVDVLNGNTASTPDLTAGSWKVGGTAITADAAEINKLDGVTATTEEINKLDGVTATTAELNHTDGVTSNIQTQLNAKASTSTSISAGGGLTGGGSLASSRTISHSDTSSQGSVNNSGNTVVQDISLDTYGHVTSIGSTTINIPTYALYIGSAANSSAAALSTGYGSSLSVNSGDILLVDAKVANSSAYYTISVGGSQVVGNSSTSNIKQKFTAPTTGTLSISQNGSSASSVRVFVDVWRQ